MHEERISKPEENGSIETSQTEMQRENRKKSLKKERVGGYINFKRCNKYVIETLEKVSENEAEEIVKVIIAKNFSY